MTARERWLDAGLTVLATEGVRAVTIERLCAELRLTKGSFYHHFGSVGGYRTALLDHFEQRETERYVEAAEGASPTARARLDRLKAVVTADAGESADLELAVRAWAAQDAEARVALERIDRRRMDYLQQLLREITGSRREAADVARLVYLVLLGSYHVLPQVPIKDVQRLWNRVLDSL